MSSRYVHCPCCEFPAVVRAYDLPMPRYCRQCRMSFIPGDVVATPEALRAGASRPKLRRRALVFRSLFRPRPHGTV